MSVWSPENTSRDSQWVLCNPAAATCNHGCRVQSWHAFGIARFRPYTPLALGALLKKVRGYTVRLLTCTPLLPTGQQWHSGHEAAQDCQEVRQGVVLLGRRCWRAHWLHLCLLDSLPHPHLPSCAGREAFPQQASHPSLAPLLACKHALLAASCMLSLGQAMYSQSHEGTSMQYACALACSPAWTLWQ